MASGNHSLEGAPAEEEVPLIDTGVPAAPEGDVEIGRQDSAKRQPRTKLGLLPLVALIFYEVSGGPFGTEDAVTSAGPLIALLGFLILPFVWSVPEALVTAELATAFPEDSGYVAWVTAAFGPFWGFQEGWWSWLSGVTDNSVYPVLFLSYLDAVVPGLLQGWSRPCSLFAVSILLSYLNYRGLTIVGRVAIGMTLFIVLTFLVLIGLSIPRLHPANWLIVDLGTVEWRPFINVMFWNLNYWDSVSTLAGEVASPGKTFPRALLMAVGLVIFMYVAPLAACLGVMSEAGDWKLGFFATVAQRVGGNWLAWWMLAAAAVSQIGQFEAEMSSDSFQLLGMAERGFLPACLARRSRHGTPTLAIILSSVGICTLSMFDFRQIVELLNIVYCLAELTEFAAFIHLRVAAPHLRRPFRICLPTWGCVLMLTPATMLLLTLIVQPILDLDLMVMGWTAGAIVVGAVMYPTLRLMRSKKWCRFVGQDPHEYKVALRGGIPPEPQHNQLCGSLRRSQR
ncbi:amino acid transporter [Coccomyxa subellipsoidea C-169]|uniref:Amino acid transporter n=1 Tax=Coccomyxa subellipsoidea (strain C-169) TaxID=574566 RepID=I0YNA3_COCSC|nr:amino acid transporter [Coccomyxa subellipsoidea C-169]EIE19872.1 amino acid transporter [Coccomyxa subellipsoidea C-169]|eukprot:XP_005644416.1 amino acid transporter [Coccomyxa subellipsoidea C-169]